MPFVRMSGLMMVTEAVGIMFKSIRVTFMTFGRSRVTDGFSNSILDQSINIFTLVTRSACKSISLKT